MYVCMCEHYWFLPLHASCFWLPVCSIHLDVDGDAINQEVLLN
jgi:hypothetical protein